MINEITNKKSVVSLAVRAALIGALTMGLAACGDDGDNSTATSTSNDQAQTDATQPVVEQIDGLTGTIKGSVVDTNGIPIVGARVIFGTLETVTNDGGQYVFEDVDVTNVNGNNSESGNDLNDGSDEMPSTLTVTILPPADSMFIGGTVLVTPQAQVNNTGGTDGVANGGASTVTASTFLDGFTVEAGTATLPEVATRVTGFLRNCTTNAPEADATVAFDFTGLASTVAARVGVTLSYSAAPFTGMSNADGYFDILVPSDSTLVAAVDGWVISSSDSDADVVNDLNANATVTTANEAVQTFVGTTEICPIGFVDEAQPNPHPYVSSIVGQISTISGAEAISTFFAGLNQGVDQVFTVNFSEALDTATFDASEVVVVLANNTGYIPTDSVVLSEDGMSLTVTTTDPVAAGTKFYIYVPQWLSYDDTGLELKPFGDDANEVLGSTYPDAAIVGVNKADNLERDGVTVDAISTFTKATYIQVPLCIFEQPDLNVEGAEAVQLFDVEVGVDGDFTATAEYSDAFQDATYTASDDGIFQLNGQATTDDRLKELADALLAFTGDGPLALGDYDQPTIRVTRGTASTITASHALVTSGGTAVAAGAALPAGSTLDVYVDGRTDGQSVTFSFSDGFGVVAATASVTVIDAIAPVTVLQDNYNIGKIGASRAQILSSSGEINYGNGGEVSNDATAASIGNPLIWVQPRHLQQKGNNNSQPARTAANTFGSLDDLSARLGGSESSGLIDSSTEIGGRSTYDRQSFAAWAATSNEIGVAFSEEISLTGTAPAGAAALGLSGFIADNGVTTDIDGNSNKVGDNEDLLNPVDPADLVLVTIADVMGLANDFDGSAVDFAGAVQDTAGTPNVPVEATNAQVVFRDAMPPFVTEAIWEGTTMTVTFNEPVDVSVATTMTLLSPVNTALTRTVTLNPNAGSGNGSFTQSQDGTQLVINVTGVANIEDAFVGAITADDATVDEFFYEDGGNAGEDQHAILRFDNILDLNGNDWDVYTPELADADDLGAPNTERYQSDAPQFLAVNGVGAFSVTVANITGLSANGAADADGDFVAELSFSHPIDVTAIGNGDAIATEAELAALLYLDIDGVGGQDADGGDDDLLTLSDNEAIEPGIDDISLSNDNTTITISINRDNNQFTVGTAWIRTVAGAQFTSSLIGTETVVIDFNVRN